MNIFDPEERTDEDDAWEAARYYQEKAQSTQARMDALLSYLEALAKQEMEVSQNPSYHDVWSKKAGEVSEHLSDLIGQHKVQD